MSAESEVILYCPTAVANADCLLAQVLHHARRFDSWSPTLERSSYVLLVPVAAALASVIVMLVLIEIAYTEPVMYLAGALKTALR